MKVRDSGMPDEEMWDGFFEPAKVLATFGLDRGVQDQLNSVAAMEPLPWPPPR